MEWASDLKLYPRYLHPRLRRGFGLGSGITYHPWIRVRDVPSKGTSGNPMGILVPRKHHLLSIQERIYFCLLEQEPDVIDIREQFPILQLNATQQLCGELDISHTRKGRYPEPFTLDFLVTRRTSSGVVFEARSVKTPSDAKDPNVRRRLSVEYQWCKQLSIDWKLISSPSFNAELLSRLTFIRSWSRHGLIPNQSRADAFSEMFLKAYQPNATLQSQIATCAKRLGFGYRQSVDEFRYCAWSHRIPVDLQSRIAMNIPVAIKYA